MMHDRGWGWGEAARESLDERFAKGEIQREEYEERRSAWRLETAAMKSLFIINNQPYGTERVYNALRLAYALAKHNAANEVMVLLMANVVLAARAMQKTLDGFYNVEHMRERALAGKGRVLLCGTCRKRAALTKASSWREHNGAPLRNS